MSDFLYFYTYFKKKKRSVSSLLFNANVSSRCASHVTHILLSLSIIYNSLFLSIILLLSRSHLLYLPHSFFSSTFSLNLSRFLFSQILIYFHSFLELINHLYRDLSIFLVHLPPTFLLLYYIHYLHTH